MQSAPTPRPGRRRQRGVASIIVVILLIVGVVYILAQAMGIVGNRSIDTAQQLDSTAALAVAESGLQRAEAVIGTSPNDVSAALCQSIAGNGPFSVGNGTVTFTAISALPPGCGAGGCSSCVVEATGTVRSASRKLSGTFVIGSVNGVAGRGTTALTAPGL